MTQANSKRKVNRNIFYSKMALNGLTLTTLGKQLDSPVSKVRVWQIMNAGRPTSRLKEIATILNSNIQTLFPKTTEEATRVE